MGDCATGVTAQEVSGMPSSLDRLRTGRFDGWSQEHMCNHVASRIGSRLAPDACALYEREANVSADYMYVSMVSDARFACSADNFTERLISLSYSDLSSPSSASSRSGSSWSGAVSTLGGKVFGKGRSRSGSESATGVPTAELIPTISVYQYVIGPLPLLRCSRSAGLSLVDGPPAYAFHRLDMLWALGDGDGLIAACDPVPPTSHESSGWSWEGGISFEGLWTFRRIVHEWLHSGAVNLPSWHPATAALLGNGGKGTVAVFTQQAQVVEKMRLYNVNKCTFWLEHYADHAWRP